MGIEKITLDMLARIMALEERVAKLEDIQKDVITITEEDDESSELGTKESGRQKSRNEIMKILSNKYGYKVRKGNRSEGSGIVASKPGIKQFNIKISYSKSYFENVTEDVICAGWHTLIEKEIDNKKFSFFIFVVADADNEFHYFIFRREEIPVVFKEKAYDAQKKIHFYFRVKASGEPVEQRETELDMSSHYNNWTIFSM